MKWSDRQLAEPRVSADCFRDCAELDPFAWGYGFENTNGLQKAV
jgi:hypothetical protein